MKGYHPEEINSLNNEELDNLIIALNNEKKLRHDREIEKAMQNFERAWRIVTDLGITIYDNDGNPIRSFNDFDWSL